MHLRKNRLAVLAMILGVALIAIVSPARARTQAQAEPRVHAAKNISALDALSATYEVDSSTATATVAAITAPDADGVSGSPAPATEKPEAPAPRIATDADVAGDVAQQTSSGANSPQQKPEGPPSNPTGQQDDNPKRILGFIPNFQTKNDDPANQQPLTVKEKYILELHQTVDFSAHIGNLFQSALQQAFDSQPHYGEGWGPYAERFGAAEGDQVTSAFFMFGFLPSVLHDDPRYFRRAKGSIWSRTYYAATRTVITRKDSGDPTFNIPVVAGFLFQQSISTAYYPPEDRTAGRVFENWGTSLAFNSGYNVLKEFYPDLLRLAFHRHHHADPTPPPPPPPSSH
jgi:hypothetical protein